jgi:hypothetical protein
MTLSRQPLGSDAEVARRLTQDVTLLKRQNTARLNEWVLSSQDGELVATRPGRYVSLTKTDPDVVKVDDLRGFITSTDAQSIVDKSQTDLLASLQEEANARSTSVQGLIDGIYQAITHSNLVNNLIETLQDAIQHFPGINVGGIGGPADVLAVFQEFWNQHVGGMVGEVGSGDAGLADIFDVNQLIASWAAKGRDGWDILGIRADRPLFRGFLRNTNSNVTLDKIALGSTSHTGIVIDATHALCEYHIVERAMDHGVYSWQGYGATSITAFYLNFYQMDPGTGEHIIPALHTSADIKALLSGGTDPVPVVYDLPSAITGLDAGDIVGIEKVLRGAGTHHIAGDVTWLKDQATYPRRWSSVRDSSSVITPASSFSPSYTTSNVPFAEFGMSSGDVALPHSPFVQPFQDVGTDITFPPPAWANIVQLVGVGGGGASRRGGVSGVRGEGGDPGEWDYIELIRGVHFDDGDDITATIPPAALGGTITGTAQGQTGGDVILSLNGHSIVCPGGEGGDALVGPPYTDQIGAGPGDITPYDGYVYRGGVAQTSVGTVQGAPGSPGNAPGGGASGPGAVCDGSPGALGRGWARFTQ